MQPDKYYVFDVSKPLHFVNIGDHTGDQDYVHTRRIMPDYELFVIKSGKLAMKQGDYDFVGNQGDVFFHLPHVIQYGTEPNYVEFYWLHFTIEADPVVLTMPQLAEALTNSTDFLTNKIVVPQYFPLADRQRFFMQCGDLFATWRTEHNQTEGDYAVTSLMLELTKQLVRKLLPEAARHSRKLQTALVYIRDNRCDPITVADVAEACMCHEKYLTYLFKKELGVSPKRYITQSKIDFAKSILISSNCSVKDVACFTGYEDEHLFMRQFRKETGMTPTEYRHSGKRTAGKQSATD